MAHLLCRSQNAITMLSCCRAIQAIQSAGAALPYLHPSRQIQALFNCVAGKVSIPMSKALSQSSIDQPPTASAAATQTTSSISSSNSSMSSSSSRSRSSGYAGDLSPDASFLVDRIGLTQQLIDAAEKLYPDAITFHFGHKLIQLGVNKRQAVFGSSKLVQATIGTATADVDSAPSHAASGIASGTASATAAGTAFGTASGTACGTAASTASSTASGTADPSFAAPGGNHVQNQEAPEPVVAAKAVAGLAVAVAPTTEAPVSEGAGEAGTSSSVLLSNEVAAVEEVAVSYDLLIAADGSNSKARAELEVRS